MSIEQRSLTEFVEAFLATIEAETGVAVDSRIGSVIRALASANAVNNMFIQAQVAQLQLDSRLDTAVDDALDTFVNQFTPPFTGRIQASAATQGPIAPTALLASATTSYLWLNSIQKIFVGQILSLLRSGKSATATVSAVQPTTTLTSPVSNGALALAVSSTAGMFPGAIIDLADGVYSASCTVQNVNSSTSVTVSALSSSLNHVYATSTTVVTMRNVVAITGLSFAGGTVIADLTAGTEVRPTTMLEGQRFYRNVADTSSPSIPAKSGTQVGYRVQTQVDGIQYEVVEDLTNPYYDSVAKAYKIPANSTEVYVKVQAVNTGVASSVQANQLVLMPSPINGIDGTNNPYAITNGADKESNESLRQRFRDFIASQASSNKAAISAAVASVSTNIQFSLLENVAADGVTTKSGNFVVLVGDVTGTLTAELLASVVAAVDKIRPITITFDVVPPVLSTPAFVIAITVDLASGQYTVPLVQAAVAAAVQTYCNSLGAGVGWNFNDLLAVIMDQSGVLDCLKLTVNGDGFDRTGGSFAIAGVGPNNGTVASLVLVRPALANITFS